MALLKRLRQQYSSTIRPETDSAATASELADITALLGRAVDEGKFTIPPRIRREPAFDIVVLPSQDQVSTPGSQTLDRGFRREGSAETARPQQILALCVGVSEYQDRKLNLNWAENDALEISRLFRSPRGPMKAGDVRVLTNAQATRDAVLQNLSDLADATSQETLLVLYLSGHGLINLLGEYYFVPHDFNPAGVISATAVSWYDLEQEVNRMKGTVLVMLDTCHSGSAVQGSSRSTLAGIMDRTVEGIVQQASEETSRGIIVMSSALTGQMAQERPEWKHGAMTLALIEAIRSERQIDNGPESTIRLPDSAANGMITLESLRNYCVARVNELTNGRQRVICRNSVDLLSIGLNAGPSNPEN